MAVEPDPIVEEVRHAREHPERLATYPPKPPRHKRTA